MTTAPFTLTPSGIKSVLYFSLVFRVVLTRVEQNFGFYGNSHDSIIEAHVWINSTDPVSQNSLEVVPLSPNTRQSQRREKLQTVLFRFMGISIVTVTLLVYFGVKFFLMLFLERSGSRSW